MLNLTTEMLDFFVVFLDYQFQGYFKVSELLIKMQLIYLIKCSSFYLFLQYFLLDNSYIHAMYIL